MRRIEKLPAKKRRKAASHKGDYGRVLIVGGSPGLTGAVCLAGYAAVRSGAGLVTLGVGRRMNPIIEAKTTCVMSLPLPDTKDGYLHANAADDVLKFALGCDAVAIGPGLGAHEYTSRLVHAMVESVRCPLVVDADGLNLLGGRLDAVRARRCPAVLTPHPGEMARLCGSEKNTILADPVKSAGSFARKYGVVVALKSHETVVTDGKEYYVNATGNPGMATGGTGDVLTGVIVSLIGQGYKPFGAACLGSYLVGLAGNVAAADLTEEALIPDDIIDYLPAAFEIGW